MATEATGGGNTRTSGLSGKENTKPSFSSKLKKFAGAVPGIVGASIVEGIGGPKARGVKAAVVGAEKIAPAVVKFAERTGAKIIADRKGVQLVAEKAAQTGKIPKVAARREAEAAAGQKAVRLGGNKTLKSVVDKPRAKVITKTGTPKKDTVSTPPKLTPAKPRPVTVTKTAPKKLEDIITSKKQAKNDRLRALLTPIKPRGVKSGGKAIAGAKPNPRTIKVAKPSKATERNKLVNPPNRKLDESRRAGMENAADRTKTPAERELEQRPDTNRVGEVRAKDPVQREADRRVAEGLKAERRAKPNPPRKMEPRAPRYTKRNIAGFKRVTGGTD